MSATRPKWNSATRRAAGRGRAGEIKVTITLTFGPPSSAFLAKHGNLYCKCCSQEGQKVAADHIPLGWPKSIVFKREFASCAAHLEATRERALQRLQQDYASFSADVSDGEARARRTYSPRG